jgi:hypothetical protein
MTSQRFQADFNLATAAWTVDNILLRNKFGVWALPIEATCPTLLGQWALGLGQSVPVLGQSAQCL